MKRFPLKPMLLLFLALAGCGTGNEPGPEGWTAPRNSQSNRGNATTALPLDVPGTIRATPLADRQPATGTTLFDRLPPDYTDIHFTNHYGLDSLLGWQLLQGPFTSGSVCLGDFDHDGLPDVYLTSFQEANRLYRNLGDMRFEDVTYRAGVAAEGAHSTGATFVDINNDGRLDLYVCGYNGSDRLLLNRGDGTFHDWVGSSRLRAKRSNVTMAFEDYDRDGDLDAYLVTNRFWHIDHLQNVIERDAAGRASLRPEFRQLVALVQRPNGEFITQPGGQEDRLFQNDGDGTFRDVTGKSGIRGDAPGLAAIWWDYNEDGWPDVYVSNDFIQPDKLYRNNRDGTFTDVAPDVLPHVPWYSMGADAADINNDGRIDFMASDMSATTHFMQKLSMGDMGRFVPFVGLLKTRQYMRNAVYVNTGTSHFLEAAYLTGLDSTDWTWSLKFADLDCDGRVDLYVTNGVTRDWIDSDAKGKPIQRDTWIDRPLRREQNLAYRNLGELQFADVSAAWGLDESGVSMPAAFSDLDRDGDLDLVVSNFDAAPSIYRNGAVDGHRLLVRLQGTRSNRYGVGARVTIETRTGRQVRQLRTSSGFMASNEPLIHFGVGDSTTLSALTVDWPSGIHQRFESLATDQLYTITEPADAAESANPASNPQATMFHADATFEKIRHTERPYNDFDRQPLLPNKLSRLGPGLAWGDVDGDGDDDFFLGGAAGSPGQLYIKTNDGPFEASPATAFAEHAESEDMGCLFLDVDRDGDLDLYVASGGVECNAGDRVLADRLYLNEGKGQFQVAPDGTLPDRHVSGSVVCGADFDRDGDIDLFVGGRVVPGQYPIAPQSALLRNDNNRFTDVTNSVAPGLRETGLVTSALWSDANGDGWIDLLVTHDWSSVKIFLHDTEMLVDHTSASGFSERSGWWNGIAGRDIDNDGDIDYATTNFGLNTKYQATFDRPALLYYGQFGGLQESRLVEAEYEGGALFPQRGRSCSSRAIPSLEKLFPTYRSFAAASLESIYTPQCLEDARRYEANTLESGVWMNDGTARFQFQPLPRLAQISPGYGVALTEVNGDGIADLCIAHNFFGPQAETGRMDGGLSLLLLGNGDAERPRFVPVWPDRSGLIVPGDAKSLTTCDLNQDGWVDFLIGMNDAPLAVFLNRGMPNNRTVAVRLVGGPGNPGAVGARISTTTSDGRIQTDEVRAGGGYLSQSPPVVVFGVRSKTEITRIDVRWPDGTMTDYISGLDGATIFLKQTNTSSGGGLP